MQNTDFPFLCTIVDDCSTDGEQGVIINYLKTHFEYNGAQEKETEDYKSILVRHKTNVNCFFLVFLLKYNHTQIKKAKYPYIKRFIEGSKYLALCEGDDYWIDSKKLQKQIGFLDNNPSFVMCHTGIKYYYEYEKKYYDSNDIEINRRIQKEGLTKEKILLGYRIQLVSVVILTKAYLLAMQRDPFLFGGYFMMGDTQLWYCLFEIGKIHFLPETTSVYRKTEGSATRSNSVEKSLRFNLSSQELRMYLDRRDNLNPTFHQIVVRNYESALKKYLYFNKEFVPLFPLRYSPKGLMQLLGPLEKEYLKIIHKNRCFLGYMKRMRKLKL